MISSALNYVRRFGVREAIRRAIHPRISRVNLYREAVHGKSGLEVGGPSLIFKSLVPIYEHVGTLDNAVFSASTIWADLQREFSFHSQKQPGRNFFLDGTDLHSISDLSYDFVISCHNLEHIANPVKALKEWQRVTKPSGYLLIVLPHYRYTFDHRRPLTSVDHMCKDWANGIGEDHPGHLQEVLELHDSFVDPNGTTKEQFISFAHNRCLHHHTFNEENAPELLRRSGYRVHDVQLAEPFNIVMLAQRS